MIRIFRHYVPMPLMLLGFGEALILLAAMYFGVSLRFVGDDADGQKMIGAIWPRALVFTGVMLTIMTAMGLYQRELRESDWGYYARFGISFVIGFVAMTLIFYSVPSLLLGRGAFALTLLLSLLGTLAARYLFLQWVNFDAIKRQVLVLGTGTRAAKIEALQRASDRHRFHVVGFLPLQTAHHFVDRKKVLADKAPLLAIARKYGVEEIVVGVRDRRNGGLPMQDILECKLAGISVVDLSTFFERETGHVQLDSLNTSWIVFSDGFLQTSMKDVTKRLFDIGVSSLLLLGAAPLMALTALAVKLDSAGPVLYRQQRVGQQGRVIDILKFRSMTVNAEKDGVPQWAQQNDVRVTRVGRIIRMLRVDELPQIFNVFRGDMSFVGPRPERPFFVNELTQKIAYYGCRHAVKPGITGWAQVRYPYGSSVEDAVKKLQYDLYYVKNHSLFLDLIILFQTAQVVLFGKGAR